MSFRAWPGFPNANPETVKNGMPIKRPSLDDILTIAMAMEDNGEGVIFEIKEDDGPCFDRRQVADMVSRKRRGLPVLTKKPA